MSTGCGSVNVTGGSQATKLVKMIIADIILNGFKFCLFLMPYKVPYMTSCPAAVCFGLAFPKGNQKTNAERHESYALL